MDPIAKANQNADLIAAVGGIAKIQLGDIFVEVLSMSKVDKGVEVYARAWSSNGKQIGFGRDGTVDVERFRFFYPRTKVRDLNGDIAVEVTDIVTGLPRQIKQRQDPKAAILHYLTRSIKNRQFKFGPENIIKGKVGRTSSDFNPPANNADDSIYSGPVGAWSTARTATDGTLRGWGSLVQVSYTGSYYCERAFYNFDTSAIADTDSIDSASFTTQGDAKVVADSYSVNVYASTAQNAIVSTDFDDVGTTAYSDTGITNWTDGGSNAWTFNSTGLAAINKTGYTKISLRETNMDVNGSSPSGINQFGCYFVEDTTDPVLNVVHTAVAAGGASPSTLTLLGAG